MKNTRTTVDIMFACLKDAKTFNNYLKEISISSIIVRNVAQPWIARFIMIDDRFAKISDITRLLDAAGVLESQIIHIYIIPESNN